MNPSPVEWEEERGEGEERRGKTGEGNSYGPVVTPDPHDEVATAQQREEGERGVRVLVW